MEWRDEAIILGLKRHGETSVILEVLTRNHGRHRGVVRGGRSKRLSAVIQPGNTVELVWRARIEEQLGQFAVEGIKLRAANLITQSSSLYALSTLASHCRLLPERDPHEILYETLEVLVDHLHEPKLIAALLIRFEIALLAELGFGIDLSCCAATGSTQELIYVSPKSARAVCRVAGEPYKDKLLKLPNFLNGRAILVQPEAQDLKEGFALTGYFLDRHVFEPRGILMPEARQLLVTNCIV
jgi:DNA repair protein RecO (recombination protein O)